MVSSPHDCLSNEPTATIGASLVSEIVNNPKLGLITLNNPKGPIFKTAHPIAPKFLPQAGSTLSMSLKVLKPRIRQYLPRSQGRVLVWPSPLVPAHNPSGP